MPKQTDYFEITYQAPFKGVHSTLPENKIPGDYAQVISNFHLKNGEIRTRPVFKVMTSAPSGQVTTGIFSFVDENTVVHTLLTTTSGIYQLNPLWRKNPKNAWNLITSLGQLGSNANSIFPANFITFITQVYIANGSPYILNWDGVRNQNVVAGKVVPSVQAISNYSTPTVAGNPVPLYFGAFYIGELNSQLIALSTMEQQLTGGTNLPVTVVPYPWRIRYSASGLPNVWDPTVNVGAGFIDEIDVPDTITGFMTIGRNGYVFRANGISEMIAINNGVQIFELEHLWASDRGIGNVYPFSISNYGPVGYFISTEDIYQLSTGGFARIGGVNRDAIYNDLAAATGNPIATTFPSFSISFQYVVYMLCIPMGRMTKIWLYSVEDKNWVSWTEETGIINSRVRLCPTS